MPARAAALLSTVVLLAGCPGAQVKRGHPEPDPAEIVAHLTSLRERASTLNADTKTDVRLGSERVNVTVMILAAWGGKLRFQALDPNSAMAADLASDGDRYCFLDVHAQCAECGEATPESVARLVRIPLEPDQVVEVLLGSTPVLDGTARLGWDAANGREILDLERHPYTQHIVLDGRERRWDVLESELLEDGKSLWKIRHKDFHEVKTADGKTARVPGASLFEQGGDTVRIAWKDQRIGEPLDDAKFRMTPPAGLPPCPGGP
jgi:outer membrane lipoprotein-sorting protein